MNVVSAPTLRFQGWRLRTGAEPELLAALGELPGLVDRVGGLLAEGTLSSEAPTAADLQIAPQLRILMCFDDLAPVIEARPAVAAWARAVVPEYPGRIPPVLSAQERAVLEGA
jgi:glutathione S-transferase